MKLINIKNSKFTIDVEAVRKKDDDGSPLGLSAKALNNLIDGFVSRFSQGCSDVMYNDGITPREIRIEATVFINGLKMTQAELNDFCEKISNAEMT